MSGSSDHIIDQMEALHAQNTLHEQNALLRAALEDIHLTAHCIAKAGPLNTPTLDIAWGKFMEIGAKATNALYRSRDT